MPFDLKVQAGVDTLGTNGEYKRDCREVIIATPESGATNEPHSTLLSTKVAVTHESFR
jgi:hypothetical protein